MSFLDLPFTLSAVFISVSLGMDYLTSNTLPRLHSANVKKYPASKNR